MFAAWTTQLLFANAKMYNEEGSQVYDDATALEEAFNIIRAQFFPQYYKRPASPAAAESTSNKRTRAR